MISRSVYRVASLDEMVEDIKNLSKIKLNIINRANKLNDILESYSENGYLNSTEFKFISRIWDTHVIKIKKRYVYKKD